MCAGPELMMAGNLFQGAVGLANGMAGSAAAKAEAEMELDAARSQAGKILKATASQRSAARAATAASGTRIDEFSLGIEQEITQAGEMDAAMTILTGNNRARSLRNEARNKMMGGIMELGGSALRASYAGWKGAKAPQGPSYGFEG